MLSPKEKKLLEKIAERQVVTKTELRNILKESKTSLEAGIKSLLEKKFITTLSFRSDCYIITKTGMRALDEFE